MRAGLTPQARIEAMDMKFPGRARMSVVGFPQVGTGRETVVNRSIIAAMMLAGVIIPGAATAGQVYRRDMQSCVVEVLYSEQLPVGLAFHHTYRATLRVTPAEGAPFVTTVEREIPWQAPPPRQGQRLRMPCDPASWASSFRLF